MTPFYLALVVAEIHRRSKLEHLHEFINVGWRSRKILIIHYANLNIHRCVVLAHFENYERFDGNKGSGA